MAILYQDLRQPEKSKNYFLKAYFLLDTQLTHLSQQIQHSGVKKETQKTVYLICFCLENISLSEDTLEDHQSSQENLQKRLALSEKHLGPNHEFTLLYMLQFKQKSMLQIKLKQKRPTSPVTNLFFKNQLKVKDIRLV